MVRKIFLLLATIFSVGTAIWFFMQMLTWTIQTFQGHWIYLLIGLPALTLLYGYLEKYRNVQRFGHTELLLTEVRKPSLHVHWFLAPWIFLSTLAFHFFGASVGRESTAAQMGASLAESFGRICRIPVTDRPIVIRMGFAAGFGAAFGVPFAGTFFALETPLLFRRSDWLHLPFYFMASWGAHEWATWLGLRHALWTSLNSNLWDFGLIAYFLFATVMILVALSYDVSFKFSQRALLKWPWWSRAGFGSLALVLLTLAVGSPKFNNLGLGLIQSSFDQTASVFDALAKLGFTMLSLLSGMKGGEVTPLMASGALFGSWLAGSLSLLTFQTGAAIGMITLFCSRLRLPATGFVMLWEVFGWQIALLGAPILCLTELAQRKWVSKFF